MSESDKSCQEAKVNEDQGDTLTIIEKLDRVISHVKANSVNTQNDNETKSKKKLCSVKLKMTNFRKEFLLSPEPKKKSLRKSSPEDKEDDDDEFNFNDIAPRQKSQSMKFKETVPVIKKVTRANRMKNFELSKIEESECETLGQESSEYFKITESSVLLDTEGEFKGKARPAKETQGSKASKMKQRLGTTSKRSTQRSQDTKSFMKKRKVDEKNEKVSQGLKEVHQLKKKNKAKVIPRHNHVWLHHVKGDGRIRNMLKSLSPKKRLSTAILNIGNNPSLQKSRVHYKNDYIHLLKICENIIRKRLNEISGNELIQYLSVPGVGKIQKLLKQIRQEINHVRRVKAQPSCTLADQMPLVTKINILALDLKSAVNKKIIQLKFLAKKPSERKISIPDQEINRSMVDTTIISTLPKIKETKKQKFLKRLKRRLPKGISTRNSSGYQTFESRRISASTVFKSLKFTKVGISIPRKRNRIRLRRNIDSLRRSIQPSLNRSFVL
ncbi:unnamed protein product [Moneuplotes crassus]|uniref:Uncharacterized protein n=1 Tax=Euplotes crassus TaxID=5936 RepID=A0AAD1X8G8_EUPCR|nr:unnamed protein product [Moneuplotes crassus]